METSAMNFCQDENVALSFVLSSLGQQYKGATLCQSTARLEPSNAVGEGGGVIELVFTILVTAV